MYRAAALLVALMLPTSAFSGYEVSSFRKDGSRSANFWNAASALDNKGETCWMVDPEQKNEGQWIQVDVPNSTVDKIAVITGFDQTEKTFFDYARIKKARVEVFSKPGGESQLVSETEVTFEDKRGWQTIDIPDAKVEADFHGGAVRLTVLEVYPGKDYPMLAVGEFRVHLKEFPAETVKLSTEPDSAESGKAADLMLDGSPRTFWAADGATEATLGFRASGYGLASIGIQPGPKPYARPKTLEITANDIPITVTLEDKAEMQWRLLPVIVGYTGGAWGEVTVKVVDTYPGDAGKGVAISEVKLNAATLEDI